MSEDSNFFLAANSTTRIEASKPGNNVSFFTDNRNLFGSMLADLIVADGKDDFVYIANWWCDVDIPLGDPYTIPRPPTLRQVLSFISKEKPDPQAVSSPPPTIPGAQVCAMLWRHKNQVDPWVAATPFVFLSLPVSIFGDPLFASINTEAIKHIGSCSDDSRGILDGEHRLFGSHHQKLLVVKNRSGLIAYVGSADFDANRLYPKGASGVKNPPTALGAPLEDVTLRIAGPAVADVLSTFVDRWKLHPEGKNHPLRGEGYSVPQVPLGNASVQVTHTYGMNYPFKGRAVRSAADAILKMIANAKRYIYFEDQYLIGTAELSSALLDRLNNNIGLNVIAVMAPLDVVGDLYWLGQRRSDFWRPLIDLIPYPSRIKVFEMTNRLKSRSGDGSYLHAKLILIDDLVAGVGSVNCSNRSWYHDSEILVTVTGDATDNEEPRALAARLRLERWSRHLGISKGDLLNINDGIAKWSRLSSTALVEPWTALQTPLLSIQNDAYKQVLDPK